MEADRISNLPDDVLQKILSSLPLREAVRTSVLASKWKYKWAMLPNLVFDDKLPREKDPQSHEAFVKAVDHVLLLHIGSIRKFKLSQKLFDLAAIDIDRWIIHLSRNSIKELVLNIWKGHRYNIPSCLFSCQNIVHLELFGCQMIISPSTFKGFKSLKNLDIRFVTMAEDLLDKLISCSPLLERLTLINCDGFSNLQVNAPNLQFIDAVGFFVDVKLENTSLLADVSIVLKSIADPKWDSGGSTSSNMLRFCENVPHIQRLKIRSFFLKYLAVGTLPAEKLTKACARLSFISVHINFKSLNEILAILCLLRSSPSLQELEISANEDNAVMGEVNSSLDDYESYTYSQLRVVNISNITGLKAELYIIRFLLLSAPVLERMTIKAASVNCSSALVLKQLLRFRRESNHAEIIYSDQCFKKLGRSS